MDDTRSNPVSCLSDELTGHNIGNSSHAQSSSLAFIDSGMTPARLELAENNPGPMECSCLHRDSHHRGLGTRS